MQSRRQVTCRCTGSACQWDVKWTSNFCAMQPSISAAVLDLPATHSSQRRRMDTTLGKYCSMKVRMLCFECVLLLQCDRPIITSRLHNFIQLMRAAAPCLRGLTIASAACGMGLAAEDGLMRPKAGHLSRLLTSSMDIRQAATVLTALS